jgi:hypothetical protein
VDDLADALGRADWRWVPAMIALKASVLVIKDWRWRCELAAMDPRPYKCTFRAIGLGYFGNIVLPFKLGELLRVGLLKRHNPDVRVGDALATVAAERALDGAVLAIMVGAVLHAAQVPDWVFRGTILLMAAMLGAIAVAMCTPLHRFVRARLPARGPLSVARKVVDALTRGTAVLRQPGPLALATACTAAAWVGESLVLFCAVRALDVPLGYTEALVVTLLMSVGLLIPSAPGQIGTHQALAVLFLLPLDVPRELALSISFILQGVALATLSSIGGYVLIREAGARDLVRRARAGTATSSPGDSPDDSTGDATDAAKSDSP